MHIATWGARGQGVRSISKTMQTKRNQKMVKTQTGDTKHIYATENMEMRTSAAPNLTILSTHDWNGSPTNPHNLAYTTPDRGAARRVQAKQ